MNNWQLRAYLSYIARTNRPILIGPWRSEIGFESVYWIPWLTKLRQRYGFAKERLFVISRGGTGIWYDAGHTVELYDYVPLARVRKAAIEDSRTQQSIKQLKVADWERKLLPLIAHDLGLRRYHLLHPSLMYRALDPWWAGSMGMNQIANELHFTPPPVPHPPLSLPLPERFVAVRFYHRHTWPMSEENKLWTASLVDRMAKKLPVVVLDPQLHSDDHQDFPLSGPNILTLKDHVTPQNNLAVQSAVIAKSQAFIGTYGGTMQLAVRLQKPAIGFYQQFTGTAYNHKVLTESLGVQQGTPTFIVKPEHAQLVFEVLAP